MTLKMTFLGSGSALALGKDNYHSNVLLQKDKDSFLIDAGSDLRFSLAEQNLSHRDIRNVYISHLHADHIGGLEWFTMSSYFDPKYQGKPNLLVSEKIIGDLWNRSLSGGLRTLQTHEATLETYYNVCPIKEQEIFVWSGVEMKLVQSIHIVNNFELVPCFGLMMHYKKKRIYYTADTQFAPKQLLDYYEQADIIFHDCEILEHKSGVHAHYSELLTIPAHLKKKIWLYHYNPGPLPDAKADGFCGFVKKGQVFEW